MDREAAKAVLFATTAPALGPPRPTFLGADTQQVNNVFVLTDQLHHFHLRDQICQVLVRGVVCKGNSQGDYTR